MHSAMNMVNAFTRTSLQLKADIKGKICAICLVTTAGVFVGTKLPLLQNAKQRDHNSHRKIDIFQLSLSTSVCNFSIAKHKNSLKIVYHHIAREFAPQITGFKIFYTI